MFIEEVNLYFRICNLPLSNGQKTNLYQLDVIHNPKAPCDSHEVVLDVFDTTDKWDQRQAQEGNLHAESRFGGEKWTKWDQRDKHRGNSPTESKFGGKK